MPTQPQWVLFFAGNGQYLAGAFAIAATAIGIVSAIASNRLTSAKNDELIAAYQQLNRQVGTAIGGEWQPLSVAGIEKLRAEIKNWRKPQQGVQIMYENEFGKDLANSLAVAFQAAGWQTKVSTGSGFGRGVKVGWNASGREMQKAIAAAIGTTQVENVELDQRPAEMSLSIIGIGAKVD